MEGNIKFGDIKTNEEYTKLYLENKDNIENDIIKRCNSVGLAEYLSSEEE